MSPRQIAFANALAAAIAAALYSVALVIFAIVDSSDFGRIDGSRLQFELVYFALYFLYFGLYLGFAIALTKQAAVAVRISLAMTATLAVVPLGASALALGFVFGMLLFAVAGRFFFVVSLLAVPITGFGVGYVFNVMLGLFADWKKSAPEVAEIRRRNLAVATFCACIAAYLAYSHGLGHARPLGLARVAEQVVVGLIGPLIHVVSAATLAFRLPSGEARAPLGRRAALSMLAMVASPLVLLSASAWMMHVRSGYQLWTAPGLLRTLATPSAIQERRRPAPDQLIRMADYVVGARPPALKASSYDWRTERFLHAKLRLGTAETAGGAVEVMLDLTNLPQTGLGYLCDEPVDGALSPCRVADFNKDLKNDPRVVRVGLYQGQSEIGRIGRTFLMSCRYSFGICRLEFVQPWYEGLRVALIFDRKEREHWAAIVRFAIPEIDRIVQRAR